MAKLVKGLGRGLKSVLKGVKKVFKKVVKSPLFKVALLAAAVYTGGQALGAWGNAGAGAGAGVGTAAGEVAGTAAGEVAGANMSLVSGGEAVGGIGSAGGLSATESAVLGAGQSGGIIGNAIKGIGKVAGKVGAFAEKHPMATAMIANSVSSALSPDETELMEEQERIRRERWQNMGVPDTLGAMPTVQFNAPYRGSPQGIIQRGMRV